MPKCAFCDKQVQPGRGFIFVELSGRLHHFCSSKCHRNWKLGREARKVRWIKKKKKSKKKS